MTIHLADRLWGQKELPFCPKFLAVMRDQYGAPLAGETPIALRA